MFKLNRQVGSKEVWLGWKVLEGILVALQGWWGKFGWGQDSLITVVNKYMSTNNTCLWYICHMLTIHWLTLQYIYSKPLQYSSSPKTSQFTAILKRNKLRIIINWFEEAVLTVSQLIWSTTQTTFSAHLWTRFVNTNNYTLTFAIYSHFV